MYRLNQRIPKNPNNSGRFADLAQLGQIVFHTKDLANLWQINNPNTLYTTLRRYAQKGLLFRVYKGMYSLKPIKEVDPLLLGLKALHRFAYVSAETVLVQKGIILQNISAITLISDISKSFSIASHKYRCRKLKDKYLYNPAGIITQGDIKIATLERAVADILYFNPRAHFDGADLIDWSKVQSLQKEMKYPLTPNYYADSKFK